MTAPNLQGNCESDMDNSYLKNTGLAMNSYNGDGFEEVNIDECNECDTNKNLNRQLLRKRAELETKLISEQCESNTAAKLLEVREKELNATENELAELKERYMLLHRAYDQLKEHNEGNLSE